MPSQGRLKAGGLDGVNATSSSLKMDLRSPPLFPGVLFHWALNGGRAPAPSTCTNLERPDQLGAPENWTGSRWASTAAAGDRNEIHDTPSFFGLTSASLRLAGYGFYKRQLAASTAMSGVVC